MCGLGKVISEAQAKKVATLCEEVIVMFDNDASIDAFKAYEQLGRYLPTKIAFIQQKDPGEMTTKEIAEELCGLIK
jgi:hypothetical protein